MNLYQQELIDHYRSPRNKGTLVNPHFVSEQHNPSCGDSIGIQGMIADGVITSMLFTGKGCVISQGAASLFAEYCQGKAVEEVRGYDKEVIMKLIGIDLGPVRIKCALLVLDATHEALKNCTQLKK
jgi:nitrogen fixation NifU-like protein